MMKYNLETSGDYEVKTETDPLQSMKAIQEFKPNLILLDLVMPEMNGSELANRIKNNPTVQRVKIVFLSGIMTEAEALNHPLFGNHPFLAKPVDLEHLLECVQKYTV